MKRCALISVLWLTVGTLAPHVAMASDAAPVVVAYRAPSECPNAEAFREQLQRRLPSGASVQLLTPAARAPGNALLLQVDVAANESEGTFVAQLSLRDPGGQSNPRRLTGPQCADLLDALAFTAALSVEEAQEVTSPRSVVQGPPPPDSSTASVSTQPAAQARPVTNSTPGSSAVARVADSPLGRNGAETYDEPGEPRTSTPGFMTWSSEARAGLTFTSPLNTTLSPGLALGLQFNAESATGWSPAVGISLQGSFSPLQVTDERASFGVLSGQAFVCPGALRSEPWTARLCGLFQLGTIHGQGEHLDKQNTINARLSSVGLVLTTSYYFSPDIFLSGQVGALMALDYHRFEVGTERRVVAETRTVAPWLALEVGTTL